ncbi:MAG: preprotein translocase subunit SecA [Bacteroidales bacterium]|jgi:preprotein translocase subunit SecA|nr:preprotein translocase subunit SecA [Bacteroidales bacterium]MBR6972560.1 preprotein translocase subunit SecA [Bacteroidales bacterium]
MSTLSDILKKLFGSKEERDLKAIKPILNKVLSEYDRVDALSDNELREETNKIRKIIRDRISSDVESRKALKIKLEDVEISAREKEKLAAEDDRLKKKINEDVEVVLNEVLPVAFAIMKSTARRFKENETIRVNATEFDKDLSTRFDYVEIDGDTAIWHNSWVAGGNMITWDMVHYDVQLIGGIVLHQGKIAEMATGEGKTLVATLPVFLNALAGFGVHMVTVNDYLAKRDSEWMGPLYQFHGLSVDCIDKHEPNSEARKKAYLADVTFGTNNEFGFDYLRDNMAVGLEDLVQREHHYAIVDEVDSVLIDDARTPLIISGPVPKGEDQQYEEYRPYVEKIYNLQKQEATRYLNEAKRLISQGNEKDGGMALLRAHKALPKYNPLIKFLSEQGMKQLLQSTNNFYMQNQNKEMHVVTDPLYFIIDEHDKSVELTDKGNEYIASLVSDPKFFVLPDVGVEVAEIEKKNISDQEKLAEKEQLIADYAIKAERVHTVTQLLKAYTLFEKDVDYVIMDNKIKIVDEQTGRIMEGRRWSDGLHQAVEAKENVKVEAATQTFATITLQNYFRMYHKLAGMTGTASTEAGEFWSIYKLDVVTIPTNKPVIRKDEEDLIYKTRKDKFNAVIDRITELRNQGRPVLVGTTSVEISEMLSKSLKLRRIPHNVLNAKLHAKEAEIVANAGQPGTVTIATNMAGRGTDIKLGPGVVEAGGLAIIGTERHDSRRVDRQLRGRAGRQGDPGSSEFYVSLEDNLMRLFGADRIAKLVDRMGMKDGEVLQHKWLSSSVERAQKKVEENNFGIRKRLLEYDDVMNTQRTVIYARRNNALNGERMDVDLQNMIADFAEALASRKDDYDYEGFKLEMIKQVSIDPQFDEEFFRNCSKNQMSDLLEQAIAEVIERRGETLVTKTFPIVERVYETQAAAYQNIAIPITDGHKVLNLIVNMKKAMDTKGKEIQKALVRSVTLIKIDEHWKQHLRDMDDLKQSVQNATYEQKDPLIIYKFEGYNLFSSVVENISRDVISFLVRAQVNLREENDAQLRQEARRKKTDMSRMSMRRDDGSAEAAAAAGRQERSNQPVHVEKKVGRNDPCPCGSGKKFKNCHGKGLV